MISENNSLIELRGIEINNWEADGNFIASLMDATALDLIWMNIDFPMPSPFTLLETLQNHNPEVRILVSLQQATVYTLRSVFQKINPHGILELVDCDQKTINAALKALIQKEVFYSKSVLLLLHKFLQTFETMDNADYAILQELDKGTPIRRISKKIFLSDSTILVRRTKLKALFNLSRQTDADLIREVKRHRYI